ncbi:MAG: apolipoprotein N-acyltransferase [Denitrovibrio sp.]|nr:MAG: apolipoprotein N-acyltransferase [Denitrovibrio sp.]
MKTFFIITISALISACFLTLASPGYNLWFLAYFALIPMLVSMSKSGMGFLTGWVFGFIYFLINLRWVITAVSEFGNSPLAVGILVTCLFALFLGLFWGIFGWLFVRKKHSPLLLAGLLVALEVVKSNILSGFPMLNLAHTQYNFAPAIQIAEVTGEYGVSLIVAYFNVALAAFFYDKNKQSIIFAILLSITSIIYGFSVSGRDYAGNDLNIRIIQPAYSQAEKWIPDNKYDIMALVNVMLRNSEPDKFDLIILPETVYPAFMNKSFAGYNMLQIFGEKVPVIAGGIRYYDKDGKRTYHNSVFMFDKEQVSIYDKRHLVPFGEYFPFKTLLKPIDYYFFKDAEDFTPGAEPSLFVKEKYSAAPMVCYESMYSDQIREQVTLGADILTVVTNDSWFGKTKGPYQHLATDVLRAVEFRKPVIRAAQSGISACIQSDGKISDSLPSGEKGYLDCKVTTHKGLTIFAIGGYGWLAVFLFTTWFISRRKQQ